MHDKHKGAIVLETFVKALPKDNPPAYCQRRPSCKLLIKVSIDMGTNINYIMTYINKYYHNTYHNSVINP